MPMVQEQHQIEPNDERESITAIDDAWREKLRGDPRVVYHRRTTDHVPAFEPVLSVSEPIDIGTLLGRDNDDEAS